MNDALIPHTSSVERHRRIIEENNMKKLKLVHSNMLSYWVSKTFKTMETTRRLVVAKLVCLIVFKQPIETPSLVKLEELVKSNALWSTINTSNFMKAKGEGHAMPKENHGLEEVEDGKWQLIKFRLDYGFGKWH